MGYDGHGDDGHHHHHDHDHPDHHHHHHEHSEGHGPEGTEFLDLEISQVLLGEAGAIAKQVALDLVREAARERLRERMGDRLAAIGQLAADELVDDVETNLEIEALIGARMEQAGALEERLRQALASPPAPPERAPASKRSGSGGGRKKSGRGKRPVRG